MKDKKTCKWQTERGDDGTKDRVFTIPNILSFFRICLIPFIVWLYAIRKGYSMAGYMLLLSGATDIADGFIARKYQMTSDLGKILDPIGR